MMRNISYVAIVLSLGLLVAFQNCSNRKFALSDSAQLNSLCAKDALHSEDCFNLGHEKLTKNLNNAPTDILFVLDESCSMEVIANNVRDGFNSLLGSQFPPNTKMAVTYMSPSNVGADGEIDFTASFEGLLSSRHYPVIKTLPGNMQLVTKDSINSFKDQRFDLPPSTVAYKYNIEESKFKILFPGVNYATANTNGLKYFPISATRTIPTVQLKYDPAQAMTDRAYNSFPNSEEGVATLELSSFTKQGCTNEWFDPKEVGADSQSCLSAAVQLAPVCTGVEAGVVSLEHMLKKFQKDHKKLFRDNAIVNIIFVSDTHEAGAGYFSRPGAPERMRTLDEIQAIIQANNPNISSIKFSGILPLPEVGNPLLEGLNTVGALPATAADSNVSGEGLYDFSYLPLIKGSKGLAAHAANGNWSAIADEIVKDSKYTGNILVTLQAQAAQIFEVKVNGEKYDLTKVLLNADKRSFTIQMNSSASKHLEIDVKYEKLVDEFVF